MKTAVRSPRGRGHLGLCLPSRLVWIGPSRHAHDRIGPGTRQQDAAFESDGPNPQPLWRNRNPMP
jgi:hypothetical protein